jgi:hypothetical protein
MFLHGTIECTIYDFVYDFAPPQVCREKFRTFVTTEKGLPALWIYKLRIPCKHEILGLSKVKKM